MIKLNIKSILGAVYTKIKPYITQKISCAGIYPGGNYILSRDIFVKNGNGLSFSGDVKLDMNGKKIEGSDNGNEWDYGILSNGKIEINSKKSGTIIGFRVGLKIYGDNSIIKNTKFQRNRYIGIMIEAQECHIIKCAIDDVGGVDDEPYAIGIQVGESKNTALCDLNIKNIYKQSKYKGSAQGEGVGINLASSSSNCKVSDCSIINDTPQIGTIGVFCGVRGGHTVSNNIIRDFTCGVGAVSVAISTIAGNTIEISDTVVDSFGIFGPICQIHNNRISEKFATHIESNDPSIKY